MNSFKHKIEPALFYTTVILFAFPIFLNPYFVTNDGPAHVYNSNLLFHYFGNYHAAISNLFELNPFPEPNWVGHFLQIILKFFFSGALSEKIVVATFFILFPISIRYLISNLNKDNKILCWLALPFVFNFIIEIGFYNFCLGMVILNFSIGYVLKHNFLFRLKHQLALFMIGILLYFSHLFVYGIFILAVILGMMLTKPFNKNNSLKFIVFQSPLLLLSLLFYILKSGVTSTVNIDIGTLTTWLLEARPLIVFNEENEKWFGIFINSIILISLLLGLIYAIIKKEKISSTPHYYLIASVSLLMMILYFLFPNEIASGGFINIRFLFLFYNFLIAMLAFYVYPKHYLYLMATIVTGFSIYQQRVKFIEVKALSVDAEEMCSGIHLISEGKTLLPLNYSGYWMQSNFSNYLASDKVILVLDNYEASTPHFPLAWKKNADPNVLLGNFNTSRSPEFAIMNFENKTTIQVDYLSRWCYESSPKDVISNLTNIEINKYFKLIYQSENKKLELFAKK